MTRESDISPSPVPTPAAGEAPPAGTAPPAARRRRRGWLPLSLLLVLSLVLAGFVALLGSEGGLRLGCRLLERLSGGQLVVTAPAGTLASSFTLASLHWRSETLDVQVQGLQLDWRPAELLRARLAISRLAADSLRVSQATSSDPVVVPESLELPLAFAIEKLEIAVIELGDHAHPDGQAATIAESLRAGLASDGGVHRLLGLHARAGGLALGGNASLAAVRPFALQATAGIEGEAAGRALRFELSAEGTLDDFVVRGAARALAAAAADDFAGELNARITPFAPQPVGEAALQLSGVDPAAWIAGAPHADFGLQIDLLPVADSSPALQGRLRAVNRRPGAIDRDSLPIESLAADLTLAADGLRLGDIDLRLAGGGRLRGSGALHDSELSLTLAASAVDAGALHGGLQHTRLAGPLRATLGLHRQLVEADLRDPRFALDTRLAIDPEQVAVERLRLAAGDARLSASGTLALAGSGSFAVQGQLREFDPRRFLARLPTARINAEFSARGSSRPQVALRLGFQLRDSRFAGEVLAGGGEIDLAADHLRQADVELRAGANRLLAKGAFGAPGERLRLSIAAPRLDPFGPSGDLAGEVVIGGSMRAPEVSASLQSQRLAWPGLGQLRGLEVDARLAAGEHGALGGRLRLAGFDLASGEAAVTALQIEADGLRSRHRLRGRCEVAGRRAVELALEGGLKPGSSVPVWTGALQEFSLSAAGGRAPPLLRLTAAMPLQISADSFSAGPGDFAGVDWSARLQRARYDGGVWQTAGSLRALPVAAMLAEFPEVFAAAAAAAVQVDGEALRIDGEWDLGNGGRAAGVAARRLPGGSLRLWRARGDLAVGALPLGLEEGVLSLQAGDGKIDLRLQVRGKRLGEVNGELSATSSAASLINRAAPWRGRLRLNMPDLAWVGPLLGAGWQLGGQLAGEARLDGSPAQPRVSGEWRGDRLAVRALDQGMRLERGKLLLELAVGADGEQRLKVRELSFDSEQQPMPRALAVAPGTDVAELGGRPGRLEASGELRLGSNDGVLNVRAERLGVTQRADQWTLLSGTAELKLAAGMLDVAGKLRFDAGFWQLAKAGAPQLSDDVVVRRPGGSAKKDAAPVRLLAVDLEVDLGRNFHFRGAGVESRLVGTVRLQSDGSGIPRATGTIRTRGGVFDAYGQKLDIERGILNFHGLIDNPGLNIRAVRANLPVEAGVEVTGTAKRPIVRLVSDPEVPDAEKLSWLVLGQGLDQQGGKDSSVLLAAAQTILGGQDGGPLKAVQQQLGIDQFGISSGTLSGSGRPLSSRIASSSGFGSSDTTTDQIVSIGKRLSSTMLISYDQSLSNAGSVVKLTVSLGRNLSLVGRAGTDTGFDVLWNHRFGR
ncbi:translocation/assembly module TamB domain-containing protein [Accumulibacter sp.]|uniref:translocation/assembly module TamB domain-containing protein n=1 Tax=Accumulibacter sp. TaxID=2053492 RepID=UPI0025FF1272|nr:translocation/assembly module TamB domain-containing protein [Accumulibacter sp.]MCM8611933.1 translocation/assembly module TamB domain-containing protein [Accumulibacter sp.]MCM8635555.1 translocation/assembly module TamB domain-containing protein [Accumulibacter sp.]MCM8639133.1 translocation/assembly module TamB domain-containing protein [Accumulibacter sp.]